MMIRVLGPLDINTKDLENYIIGSKTLCHDLKIEFSQEELLIAIRDYIEEIFKPKPTDELIQNLMLQFKKYID